LTRRALLVTAAVGVTAACTGPSNPPPPPPRPTPEQLARAAAAARETELHGLAAAALDAYPTLVGARQTYAFTAAHAAALSETLVPSPSPSASSPATRSPASRASASATATTSRSRSPLAPGTRTATARSLAAALLDAAGAHRAASTSVSPDLARLLASVAASDSALAAKLTRAIG
jgi:hypothetical protein